MEDVNSTLSLLLGGIAAISLIVGGIGIMNIMLVSVTERTREIGIRKAIGAKRSHILTQFLCEACILSVLGGVLGLLLSVLTIKGYNYFADSAVTINTAVAAAAIAFCTVIGIGFGSYPAAKASKLQPIDALHTA
ncbi:MAG: FtsX-like permease family protein [Ruminococcus sp.]|nr:FtsX-like permease family protein [Ruminococcus sp.]